MNERIKELILEAGFPKFDERYVVSHGKELERFTKLIVLIVKECVDICYEIDKDYAGEDVLATWCADEIRKRFSEKPHFFAKEISERLRELNMTDRERLEAILKVVCDYLPSDGISRKEAMSKIIGLVDPLPEQSESQEPVGAVEYSAMKQMQDQCDVYMEIHDAIAEDNDLLYAILRRAEVEMRYAGWDNKQEDNYGRYEVYNRIQEVLKGEEISDAESQEPVESNDLQGFISDDRSHILVYPKGSYPEEGVDLYTAPLKREWVGLTDEDVDSTVSRFARYELARAIEAKLKEKNA